MLKYLPIALFFVFTNISFAELQFSERKIDKVIPVLAKEFPFSYDFKNVGNTPVRILKISTSCSCTKAEADKEIYKPNEEGKFSGTFEIGDRIGLQSKKIFIETDDKTNPKIILNLNLTIPVLAEFRPKMLLWRKSGSLKAKTLHVDTAREYGARIQKVSCDNENFKINFAPQKENTDSCEVQITPLSLNEVLKAEVELECITKNKELKIYKLYLLVR